MCRSSTLELAYSEAGEGDLVVILHGFLGSGRNWQSIAKQLAKEHRVVWLDMRNHGNSPWSNSMSYPEMAGDVVRLIDKLGAERASVVGHSMGGKAAMMAALLHPDRLEKLLVVDIAPVAYDHSFDNIFQAMRRLDLSTVTDRRSADQALAASIAEQGLRSFILQNLDGSDGRYQWRCNLDILEAALPMITGWSLPHSSSTFDKPAMFLYGGLSDYVGPKRLPMIRALFPNAASHVVEGAGHWLHAEAPGPTLTAIKNFLDE